MPIYFSSFQDLEHYTHQLQHETCQHCNQAHQLLSHGYIRKKRAGSSPVGKRIFCSNRLPHTGCGRTSQLYLDSVVPALHYQGSILIAFFLAFIQGMTIAKAYSSATGACSARNAYRWLHKAMAQLSLFRSLFHTPLSAQKTPDSSLKRVLLGSTFHGLLQHFGEPLCSMLQLKLQRAFL
jgi:hypothetical protein